MLDKIYFENSVLHVAVELSLLCFRKLCLITVSQ